MQNSLLLWLKSLDSFLLLSVLFLKSSQLCLTKYFLGLELIPVAVTLSYCRIISSAYDLLLSPGSLFMDCTNISHCEENPVKRKAV